MLLLTKDSLKITISKDMECISDLMGEYIKDSGCRTRCMAVVTSCGLMGGVIEDTTKTIKNTDLGSLSDPMAGSMKDIGRMGSSMVKGYT